MSEISRPDLSAIVITPRSFETVRKTVEHLHAQDIRDRIEIVIGVPSEQGLEPDRELLGGFWGWQIVEVGEIDSLGPVMATCVRAARGPVVVYVEEHSYPEPGWAAALVQAHAGPWAAVGPEVMNANPESAVSWTAMFLDFTDFVAPRNPGPAASLASHQTSYKRDLLLAYGPRLDRFLENETTLQVDLMREGHRLYYEPAARTNHVNVSRLRQFLGSQFFNCREFGANRASLGGWGWRRRLLYVAGSPLIPAVRGGRILRRIRRSGLERSLLVRMLPSMLMGLASASAGELVGYVWGKGDASRRRVTFELERMRYVTELDRRQAPER
ncbi:MAG TPA: hypothetical protein VFH82_09775 [Gemmatimonadota bacterium]|nr:hypothetical protein [Gemmatimonadota bacterium]